jgi:glutamate-ammonia-ligase adenylyltransferase
MYSSLYDVPLRTLSPAFRTFLGTLPPDVLEQLAEPLENCIDQERLEHYLPEFCARFPGLLAKLAQSRTRNQWLVATFCFSRFLSEELLQHPEWLNDVPDVYRVLSLADYGRRLEDFLQGVQANVPRALDFAEFRRRELFRILLRDALNLASLSEITEELSNLADAILQRALTCVLDEMVEKYGTPSGLGRRENSYGFSVVALGKLGGRELNYSSDVDLLFLYRENGETAGPAVTTNREFYKKVANRYTELLSTYTPEGLCYRVDLRLRPEGTLGEVCVSLEGAKHYYSRRARDWELQMLIKARVAAGDPSVGQEMLESVEPSIYSTSTDFLTIDTMSSTRERLAEKLSAKRIVSSELDVKLTRGGIRDIEFLVQCLQRLHGGRDEWVRHGGTMFALSRLLDKDLLSSTEYSRLLNAYQFLRHVEHRLQFEDDRQTHNLPSDPKELDRIARRMPAGLQSHVGVRPGTALLRDLNQHLEYVQTIYERIVHAQRPLSYGPLEPVLSYKPPDPVPSSSDLKPASDGGISQELLDLLQRDAPVFIERLVHQPKLGNHRLMEQFLEQLKTKPEWLGALDHNPVFTEYLLQILKLSPYFTEQLVRDPQLLAELRDVADHPNRRAAFEGLASPLSDIGALRLFFRREMLRIQTASICVPEPVFQTLDRTSALAEFMIARAYRIALERSLEHARKATSGDQPFFEPESEMMVIALGRLGMREFDLASDADIVFIIPDREVERQTFWTRVAEHVIEILTAYTEEGSVLSIDTRLRPDGREGPLVQTESKYTDYFANRSEAWEGIAYMKARAVAGDIERATEFLTELQEVDWRRWGQGGRSKHDLKQMRLRLEREQGEGNPLKAGRGGYYDADFALMYLRLKGAGLFFKSLNTPERIDIVEKMGHLERSDAEFLLRAATFYRALDHGIRIAGGHAQGRLPKSEGELEMLAELVDRWTARSPGSGPLEVQFASLRNSMRQLFDSLFA